METKRVGLLSGHLFVVAQRSKLDFWETRRCGNERDSVSLMLSLHRAVKQDFCQLEGEVWDWSQRAVICGFLLLPSFWLASVSCQEKNSCLWAKHPPNGLWKVLHQTLSCSSPFLALRGLGMHMAQSICLVLIRPWIPSSAPQTLCLKKKKGQHLSFWQEVPTGLVWGGGYDLRRSWLENERSTKHCSDEPRWARVCLGSQSSIELPLLLRSGEQNDELLGALGKMLCFFSSTAPTPNKNF